MLRNRRQARTVFQRPYPRLSTLGEALQLPTRQIATNLEITTKTLIDKKEPGVVAATPWLNNQKELP